MMLSRSPVLTVLTLVLILLLPMFPLPILLPVMFRSTLACLKRPVRLLLLRHVLVLLLLAVVVVASFQLDLVDVGQFQNRTLEPATGLSLTRSGRWPRRRRGGRRDVVGIYVYPHAVV